jgi:amidase
MSIHDPFGAFVADIHVDEKRRDDGPLAGLTFAVKDLFDIAGAATGAGSPEWRRTHGVPASNAPVVDMLLKAGARLVGKTHTDEMAWSLNGENFHYGTPINPAAPGRVPGGSSSGSAAAVAGNLVDFAIGSDTGGSVRLPASYCGVVGMRTTHGRIPISGAVPLAPSYDTVGWFARDPALFSRVGAVLLGDRPPLIAKPRLLIADDLFAAAGEAVKESLRSSVRRVAQSFDHVEHIELAEGELSAWRNAFRLIQSSEAWAAHGAWVEAVKPAFGPGVRERFKAASMLNPDEVAAAKALRVFIRQRMEEAIGAGGIVLLPTAPGIAPLIGTPEPELDAFRARALELLSPAGHAGLPQLSLPLALLDGCPIGLSLMGARDADKVLIEVAQSNWPSTTPRSRKSNR